MEQTKVIRSAFLIGSLTLVSRALGLVRDFLTAGFFGTSLAMSAFVVAFRIPNLFRALFGEGALSSAFIPVFMKSRQEEGNAAAWDLARKVVSLTGLALLAFVLIVVTVLTIVIHQPGLNERAAMILPLARIMIPYMMFICLAALSMAMLNSYHRFALPAMTPSLLNIVWIISILCVCPFVGNTLEQQIFGVAWGVFVAGLVQLGAQIPALYRCGYRLGFTLDWRDARVWRVFTLMGPAAIGLAVTQVNVMINSLLATWVGFWAPAALFYAERLLYFPQGILATALSTVLLPVLSGHAARYDHDSIKQTVNDSLRALLFVMAPAAIGLVVLAQPIVQMIFEWGHFSEKSTILTARALWFYAPGLFVFCLAKVFVPAFYALQDPRSPVRIGLVSVAINFTLNIIFIMTWPLYWKHAGLALATVLSEGFNGLSLCWLLRRRLGPLGLKRIGMTVLRSLLGAGIMGVSIAIMHTYLFRLGLGWGLPAKINQISSVLVSIGAGAVIYVACAIVLRSPELLDVYRAFSRRKQTDKP